MGYVFWYGYHVPAVRRRDLFYEKLEKERVAKYGGNSLSRPPALVLRCIQKSTGFMDGGLMISAA